MSKSHLPSQRLPEKTTVELLRKLTYGLGLKRLSIRGDLNRAMRRALGIEATDSESVVRDKLTVWIEQRIARLDRDSQMIARVAWNLLRIEDMEGSAQSVAKPSEPGELLEDVSQSNLEGRREWLESRQADPRPRTRTIQRRTKKITQQLAHEIDASSEQTADEPEVARELPTVAEPPTEVPPDNVDASTDQPAEEHRPEESVELVEPEGPAATRTLWRRRRWWIVGALVLVLIVGLTALAVDLSQHPKPTPPTRTIVTSVLLTSGPTAMVESGPPAYLSSLTIPSCKAGGCALPGTDVHSGAQLQAYCQTQGSRITNGNDSDPADDTNPGLKTSYLWYGVLWPDGRTGFFSEVWVRAEDRGGLGLPEC